MINFICLEQVNASCKISLSIQNNTKSSIILKNRGLGTTVRPKGRKWKSLNRIGWNNEKPEIRLGPFKKIVSAFSLWSGCENGRRYRITYFCRTTLGDTIPVFEFYPSSYEWSNSQKILIKLSKNCGQNYL